MMDWTDRHCRYFHRQISRQALLYTEMVTSAALVRGDARELLTYNAAEHPVALQLGGSDPVELAKAALMGADAGFDEINLNVGCPSDRVQSGCFGAVLMKSPDLVAECVGEMIAAQPREVTVKCRIGVDEQEPAVALPRLLEAVSAAGVRRVAIHARKAWLSGLSPKDNRTIPPLDYDLVLSMKALFPELHVSLNGGIASLQQARDELARGFDGVMLGRAAYQAPWAILAEADRTVFGQTNARPDRETVIEAMVRYTEAHIAAGGRAHNVMRHMLGLFSGSPGARAWRRQLSTEATRPGATAQVIVEAYRVVKAANEGALA